MLLLLLLGWMCAAFAALWIFCLLAVMLSPRSPRPFPSGNGAHKRNVLLVTAHPDDESMFFAPTLLSLASLGIYQLHILCLSNGNAEGLGVVRMQEMLSACSKLKLPMENVEVLNDPALQDGHHIAWSSDSIMHIIKTRVQKLNVSIIITFDGYGVSGHPNHIAVYRGVCAFLLDIKKDGKTADDIDSEVWILESVNIVKKYCGPMGVICWKESGNAKVHQFINRTPQASIAAMKQHATQWLWYRRLFVLLSHYTYMNTLHRVET